MPAVAPALDGVIVVTRRGADHPRSGLATAAAVAQDRGCPLLVLTSGAASGEETRRQLAAVAARVVCLDSDQLVGVLPSFEVDHVAARFAAPTTVAGARPAGSTIGQARNLGLAIARAAGWVRVLFLDDDVATSTAIPPDSTGSHTLDGPGLTLALKAIDDGSATSAVAWSLEGFDDNSVVCRARALVGDPQQRFIGAGALLVRCGPQIPFFPSIYNEDWLFLLALQCRLDEHSRLGRVGRGAQAGGRDTILVAGSVHQDGYEPFAPGRAAREEFGDLLAEGLFSLLHADALTHYEGRATVLRRDPFELGVTDPLYWHEVIRRRRAMILHLRRRSRSHPSLDLRRSLSAALAEAQSAHLQTFWSAGRGPGRARSVRHDAVSVLIGYLHRFKLDQANWGSFLDGVDSGWLVGALGVHADRARSLAPRATRPTTG